MSSLDEQLQAARDLAAAQEASNTLSYNQQLQQGLGALNTSQAEIGPYYDILGRELKKSYNLGLDTTRESASSRGVYRSGILSNQEMKMGTDYMNKVGDYATERARKLTDISSRRSLLTTQTAQSIGAAQRLGGAQLNSTLLNIRNAWDQTQAASSSSGGGGYSSSGGGGGSSDTGPSYQEALQSAIATYNSGGSGTQGFRENVIKNLNSAYGVNSARDVYTYMPDQLPYVGR